jgi:hypothetical protein
MKPSTNTIVELANGIIAIADVLCDHFREPRGGGFVVSDDEPTEIIETMTRLSNSESLRTLMGMRDDDALSTLEHAAKELQPILAAMALSKCVWLVRHPEGAVTSRASYIGRNTANGIAWVNEAENAVQFAREEDAITFIKTMRYLHQNLKLLIIGGFRPTDDLATAVAYTPKATRHGKLHTA